MLRAFLDRCGILKLRQKRCKPTMSLSGPSRRPYEGQLLATLSINLDNSTLPSAPKGLAGVVVGGQARHAASPLPAPSAIRADGSFLCTATVASLIRNAIDPEPTKSPLTHFWPLFV